MSLNLQIKTIQPDSEGLPFNSEGKIEIFSDSEFDALGQVNVLALPNSYIKPNGKVPETDIKYDGTDFNISQYKYIDIKDSRNWKANYMKGFRDWAGINVIIPEGTKRIESNKFGTFNYSSSDDHQSIKSIILPNNITEIGDYAFNYCKSLTSFTIPDSVTKIGESAFGNCSKLEIVDLSCESLKTINRDAFKYCTSLVSIIIGPNVNWIRDNSFWGVGTSTNKATYIFLGTTPPNLGFDVFYNGITNKIYVPAESVENYKTNFYWRTYASLIEANPNP